MPGSVHFGLNSSILPHARLNPGSFHTSTGPPLSFGTSQEAEGSRTEVLNPFISVGESGALEFVRSRDSNSQDPQVLVVTEVLDTAMQRGPQQLACPNPCCDLHILHILKSCIVYF